MVVKLILFFLVMAVTLMAGTACATQKTSQLTDDKTWISPSKVQINNIQPGSSVKQKITIHNGSETATKFLVYYRKPDYVQDGFAVAPVGARDWVKIEDEAPLLAPRETRDISLVLDLPDDAQLPERWEFWIGVKENNGSSVITELASRWLITMRGN